MLFRKFVLSFAFSVVCCLTPAQNPALKLEHVIPLPGVEGRIDHLSADVDGKRVFVAALGNGTVEVVDLNRGQRAGEIKGLKEPQGLLYLPSNRTLYVATGGDGMVRAYNGQTLALAGSVVLGDDADNLRFDHQTGSVMVGYGDGAIASLPLDLNGKQKAEVRLSAHPESFQVSSDGSRVLVNLPNDQSIALIDPVSRKVISKWTHLGARANFPMAVDAGRLRFFVACRAPAQMLELHESDSAVSQRIATVGDADDLFYDAARKRIYVIGGEGFVDVVDAPDKGKLASLSHVATAAGARTGLFVPAWNQLLVAAPHRGAEPARLLVYSLP